MSIIASAQRVFRRIILVVRVGEILVVAYNRKSIGIGLDQLVECRFGIRTGGSLGAGEHLAQYHPLGGKREGCPD